MKRRMLFEIRTGSITHTMWGMQAVYFCPFDFPRFSPAFDEKILSVVSVFGIVKVKDCF